MTSIWKKYKHCLICGQIDTRSSIQGCGFCEKCNDYDDQRKIPSTVGYPLTEIAGSLFQDQSPLDPKLTINNWRTYISDRLCEASIEKDQCIVCKARAVEHVTNFMWCSYCRGRNGPPISIIRVAAGHDSLYNDSHAIWDSSNWFLHPKAREAIKQAGNQVLYYIVVPGGSSNQISQPSIAPQCNLCKKYSLLGGICKLGHKKPEESCFDQA